MMLKNFSLTVGRFAAAGCLLVGLAGTTLAAAAPASASGGWVLLKNMNSGLCLHASSGGGPGAWVTQENCNREERGQWWYFGPLHAGDTVYSRLYNSYGNCLDTWNGYNPGTVIVWSCNYGRSQDVAMGSYSNLQSGSNSVEPPGMSGQSGTQMIIWPTNGSLNQGWVRVDL
ncbi:RICIN domain-containing protein [Streptomyces sp. NPDC051109]|uniref:RICIN domain-containing protein n=1 Tax=Streptomyces sp. NPDC051109 TaxID=3365642 RepID=UPI0037904719